MTPLASSPLIHMIDTARQLPGRLQRVAHQLGACLQHCSSVACLLADLDPARACVILADASLPDDGALNLLGTLQQQGAGIPLIVTAAGADGGDVDLCRRAFRAGATDFLPLDAPLEVLAESLRKAIGTQVLNRVRHQRERRTRALYARLSVREKEVLGMVVAGLTNKEVARALSVSPRTVEVHRARLGIKLETDSLAQLVREYAQLVDEDDGGQAWPACGRALGSPLAPSAAPLS